MLRWSLGSRVVMQLQSMLLCRFSFRACGSLFFSDVDSKFLAVMPTADHCCVYECTNRRAKNPELSFHSFPSALPMQQRWAQAIRREVGEHFTISPNTVVSSAHSEDFSFLPQVKVSRKNAFRDITHDINDNCTCFLLGLHLILFHLHLLLFLIVS